MRTRARVVVAVSAVVLLAGVLPYLTVGVGTPVERAGQGPEASHGPEVNYGSEANHASLGSSEANVTQYKVSLDNVTIETWLLRNSTVENATVRNVTIRNATTPDGTRTNVTLENVTVGTFVIERGRLKNVTAERLVVRNKSVLDIPGGDLVDPNVQDRTIERHWTENATAAGVVIDELSIDAAILCANASLGEQAPEDASFSPTASGDDPAVTVTNGTVGEALIIRGQASNWSVGSVDQPAATNATLPDGCNRG